MSKKIYLLVGIPNEEKLQSCKELFEKYDFLILIDNKDQYLKAKADDLFCYVERVNFNKPESLELVINKYKDRLVAANSAGGERNVQLLEKLLPHVQFLNVPTQKALSYYTSKEKLRSLLSQTKFSPKYLQLKNKSDLPSEEDLKFEFPVIIKPESLASSLLVTKAYTYEELKSRVNKIFKGLNKVSNDWNKQEEVYVLVEEFIDGREYSIDGYVDKTGKIEYCPAVYIKRATDLNIKDFYHYYRATPIVINKAALKDLKATLNKIISKTKLQSSSFHAELIRTNDDRWLVVEIGARPGGYRQWMYNESYDFNHNLNDWILKLGKKTKIRNKPKAYSSCIEIFPAKKGRITKTVGFTKIKQLASFKNIVVKRKKGDRAGLANQGFKPVASIYLSHENKSQFIADRRWVMDNVFVETDKTR